MRNPPEKTGNAIPVERLPRVFMGIVPRPARNHLADIGRKRRAARKRK